MKGIDKTVYIVYILIYTEDAQIVEGGTVYDSGAESHQANREF